MQKSSFGRTLLLSLGFLTPLSQTMGSSLTVKHAGDTTMKWALETDI